MIYRALFPLLSVLASLTEVVPSVLLFYSNQGICATMQRHYTSNHKGRVSGSSWYNLLWHNFCL